MEETTKTRIPYRLFKYFISGTIVVLPLVVTVAIVLWLSNFFLTWLGPDTGFGQLLSRVGINFSPDTKISYLFGWGIVLFTLFLIGFITEVLVRKTIFDWVDTLIKKIPLVGMIYGTTRKFTELLNKDGNKELKGMMPVYCRFGSRDGGVMVLALLPTDEVHEIEGHQYCVVVIPTAPIPFGGGMFFVPKEDVIPANMTIDALMSFYVSMGVAGK